MSGHGTGRAAVVILNWNSAGDTIECVESVLRIDYPNYQIVICDNGSSDDSVERIRSWAVGAEQVRPTRPELHNLLEAPRADVGVLVELDLATAERGGSDASKAARVVLVHNGGNLGYAGGNNVGLRYAKASGAEYVCLLNNDTVVSRTWLSRLVATMGADESIGAVGAMLFEYFEPELVESAGGGVVHAWQGMPRGTSATRQRRRTSASIPRRLDFVSGACALMRTTMLDQVGFIDERFFLYCEDIDLSLRMRQLGYRIVLANDAEVWHKNGGSTRRQGARRDYYIVRNSLLLVHKRNPMMLPAAVAFSFYRCVLPKLVRRDWVRLRAVASAYRDFFSYVAGDAESAGMGRHVTGPSV